MQNTPLIEERKRKFLIILPVLVIPFVAFLFYILGGGKGDSSSGTTRTSALSTTLPDPLVNEHQQMDKLSLYERASRDSQEQSGIHDPFEAWPHLDSGAGLYRPPIGNTYSYGQPIPLYPSTPPLDDQLQQSREAQLEQRLQQLQRTLQAPDEAMINTPDRFTSSSADSAPELKRIESLMQSLSTETQTADPGLAQASSLMDKILDVQHPERVNQRIKKQSLENRKNVFPVSATPTKEINDFFSGSDEHQLNEQQTISGFYDEEPDPAEEQNALRAVVHESQTLVSGATIKLRLEQDAYVQGQLISKGSFVFGICTLSGERLEVAINSVRKGNSIFPVSLIAYDLDGLAGIRVPGSINRDASKESSERAVQAISLGSLDPSIGAQAASAGIEAAKNLLSRKVKLIKVVVKAGYPLLIAPDKTNS